MWCLCNLKISLQSTSLVHSLVELLSGISRTLFQGFQQIPKVITEVIEKSGGRTVFSNTIANTGAEGISGLHYTTSIQEGASAKAVARTLFGGGGLYSYIRVLPD